MSSRVRKHDKSRPLRTPRVALYPRTSGNLARNCVNLTRKVVNFARQIVNVTREIDSLDRKVVNVTRNVVNLDREVVNVTREIDNFGRDVDEISPAFGKGAPVIDNYSCNVANVDRPSDNFAPQIVRPPLHVERL